MAALTAPDTRRITGRIQAALACLDVAIVAERIRAGLEAADR